ncbi:MAG: maleylpyruvate isomerase N-terminal domain-containing protein [Nocardioidaceae bacterium]
MPPTPAISYLPWERYTGSVRDDTDRLLEVAAPALHAPVPSCPGWVVEDLVRHLAAVYLHKVECIRRAAAPEPWPPAGHAAREPIGLLEEARDTLLAELTARDPYEERFTWWDPDQTNGFWFRRMALEVAVHRVDGELARVDELGPDVVTPIADDIALDGIDEILRIFLGGPWWDGDFHTAHPIDAAVRVTAEGRSWTVAATATAVVVTEETDSGVQAEIAGTPNDVYLWLWGRGPLEALSVTGDEHLPTELRARLVEDDD